MVIGVDLDNTIISYDRVLNELAAGEGLVESGPPLSKRALRDRLRRRPGGEDAWRRLQALIYGPLIDRAEPIDGVTDFFRLSRREGAACRIVSHKTEFANNHDTGANLREAAMGWLRRQGFFDPEGAGLDPAEVFFESDRRSKIARIAELGCAYFIDDLAETFREEGFPETTRKILYDPAGDAQPPAGAFLARDWREIRELVLGRAH